MSDLIHISIDDIFKGWKHSCVVGCSVGRITKWGGHYICTIHDDVPVDEREEIAKFIANAPKMLEVAVEALTQADKAHDNLYAGRSTSINPRTVLKQALQRIKDMEEGV